MSGFIQLIAFLNLDHQTHADHSIDSVVADSHLHLMKAPSWNLWPFIFHSAPEVLQCVRSLILQSKPCQLKQFGWLFTLQFLSCVWCSTHFEFLLLWLTWMAVLGKANSDDRLILCLFFPANVEIPLNSYSVCIWSEQNPSAVDPVILLRVHDNDLF